ncbi:MAG: hypothetical protein AAGN35_16885 [Bacteroidota bacterium]
MKSSSAFSPGILGLIIVLFLVPFALQAQDLQVTLDGFNAERLRTNRTGMSVLGGWAIANIGFSGVQYFRTEGVTKGFHQMNVFWNIVNLGLAVPGFLGSAPGSADGLSIAESVREQQKMEKILLFNTGLDVGYVMAGFFLRERSRNSAVSNPDRMRGWGNSLILQGGFLFAFDLTLVLFHSAHGNKGIMKFLETVQVGPGTLGLNIPLN